MLFLLYFPMAAIGYGVLGSEAGSNIIYSLAPGPAKVRRTRIALIKKKIKFSLRWIQNGAVAKSYMTNGLTIYGEIFVHFLIY